MEQANTASPHHNRAKGGELHAWKQESDPNVIVKSFGSPPPLPLTLSTSPKEGMPTPTLLTGKMLVEKIVTADELADKNKRDEEALIKEMFMLNLSNKDKQAVMTQKRRENDKKYKRLSQVTKSCPKPGETLYKWLILEEETVNEVDKRKVCHFDFTAFDKTIKEENEKIRQRKKKNPHENVETFLNSSSIIRIFPDQLDTLKKEKNVETNIAHIIQALSILPMPVHVSPVLCLLFRDRMNQCLSSFDVLRLLLMVKKIIMSSKGVISEKKKTFLNMQAELARNSVFDSYTDSLDGLALEYEHVLYDKYSLHAISIDQILSKAEEKDNGLHILLNQLYDRFVPIIERYTISLINIYELFIIQSIIFDSNDNDAIPVPLNIAKMPTTMNVLNINDGSVYINLLTQYNSFFAKENEGGYYNNSMFNNLAYDAYMKTLDRTLNKQQIFCVKQLLETVISSYNITSEKDFHAVLPDWLQTSVDTSNEDNTDNNNARVIDEYCETLRNIAKILSTVKLSKMWKIIDTVRNAGDDHKKYLAGTVVLYFFRFLTLEHPKWLKTPTKQQNVKK